MPNAPDAEPVIVGEINTLTDRAAMGLPEGYRRARAGEEAAPAVEKPPPPPGGRARGPVRGRRPALRDAGWAAGLLLGLTGDPRLDTGTRRP